MSHHSIDASRSISKVAVLESEDGIDFIESRVRGNEISGCTP